MISHQFIVWGNKWPCFSPDGEYLSFASPKERYQRKGDPSSSPFGFPNRSERTGASPTRPGGSHKTRPTAELRHGYALFPSVHFDSAIQQGEPGGKSTGNRISHCKGHSMVHPLDPLLCRREAQPHGEKRRRVSELRSTGRFVPRVRASCGAAPGGEHRREAAGRHSRGRLFFGDFRAHALAYAPMRAAAKQKKDTRHQAKSTAHLYLGSPP